MSKYDVERDWITESGFRAVCIMGHLGHRCGYVGVPVSHPLHGVSYHDPSESLRQQAIEAAGQPIGKRGILAVVCTKSDDDGLSPTPETVFDVHGSLTYSGGGGSYPVESDCWWFGFDCGHNGDLSSYRFGDGVERTEQYVADECESLAKQITAAITKATTP
tara:strand:+ start:7002 stop:7487 length:486 start_codon:yes stop_codon:yes gene_type:complete